MQNSTILITESCVSFLRQTYYILDLLCKEGKIHNLADFWLGFFDIFKSMLYFGYKYCVY